jgi:hypothetical protein
MKQVEDVRVDSVIVTQIVITPGEDMNTIDVTATLFDSKTNSNVAYAKPTGIWTKETYDALSSLIDRLETDIAESVSLSPREARADGTGTGGGLFEKP